MPDRTISWIWRWARRTVVAAMFVISMVWLIQTFVLPVIVRKQVIQQLEAMGFASPTVEVDQVSVGSTTLRDLDAGEALSVKLVHVTYSPLDLLRGKVAQIVVDGAVVHPGNWPTIVSKEVKPVTTSPFAQLDVLRSAIVLPASFGSASIPVEMKLQEGSANNIRGSLEAQFAGVGIKGTFTSNYDFTLIQGDVDAAVKLSALMAAMGQAGIAGDVSVKAKGWVKASGPMQWRISSCQARVTDFQYGSWIAKSGGVLDIKAMNDGKLTMVELLPASSLSAGQINLSGKWPTFPASIQFKPTRIVWEAGDWKLITNGADISAGDVRFGFGQGALAMANRRVTGDVSGQIDLGVLGKSQLLQSVFPQLAKVSLGGLLELKLARAREDGEDKPALTAHIRNGTIGSQEYQLSAEGIEGTFVLIDPAKPHSPPGQNIKLRYGQMGKWEVRDCLFQFAMQDLGTLIVEKTELGWSGGRLWTDPYDINITSPLIRTRVYARELDLGKLIWVITGENAWADGLVDMELPVTFLWPRIRFGDGYVEARSGGVLHLNYVASQLEQYLMAADPRFSTDKTYALIRERMSEALRNFKFSVLRTELHRKAEHLDTVLTVRGAGQQDNGQEVNLNVNVEDLDWLVSRYLTLKK